MLGNSPKLTVGSVDVHLIAYNETLFFEVTALQKQHEMERISSIKISKQNNSIYQQLLHLQELVSVYNGKQ